MLLGEPAVALDESGGEGACSRVLRHNIERVGCHFTGHGRQRSGIGSFTQLGQLAAEVGELAFELCSLRDARLNQRAQQRRFARTGEPEHQEPQSRYPVPMYCQKPSGDTDKHES